MPPAVPNKWLVGKKRRMAERTDTVRLAAMSHMSDVVSDTGSS
jgi:hypothetical protein